MNAHEQRARYVGDRLVSLVKKYILGLGPVGESTRQVNRPRAGLAAVDRHSLQSFSFPKFPKSSP